MTFRQIFIQTVLWGLLIILGLYIAFKVTWTISAIRLLGIVACLFIGFGSLMFSVSLTKLFFKSSRTIETFSLFDKDKYKMYKKTKGNQFTIFSSTYILVWILTCLACGYWYFTYTSIYKLRQLEQFSQLQKVKINDIVTFHNLSRQVEFEYYYNNEKYSNRLPSEDFQIGDSVDIYFSSENPDIVSWDGRN